MLELDDREKGDVGPTGEQDPLPRRSSAKPTQEGLPKLYVAPETFAEFLGVSEDQVTGYVGPFDGKMEQEWFKLSANQVGTPADPIEPFIWELESASDLLRC